MGRPPSTITTIVLSEHESIVTRLPREAVEALRARFSGRIEVAPAEDRGSYRLSAGDHVGRVSLPGGLLLVIRPKVDVANLFYMLAAASGLGNLSRFFPPPTALAANPELFEFILSVFVDQVEGLFRRGLYAAHMPAVADLPLVRGRILLGPQISRHADLKHSHICAYSDLTPDTPENRVLRAALNALPSLLVEGEARPLVRRARSLLARFNAVKPVTRTEALALLRGISLHRLNAAYGPALGLARLALQQLTLEEAAGAHPFASFLVDMPRLFESFVTEGLRVHLRAAGLRVVAQRSDYLDESRRVGIRPDVLVYRAGSGRSSLVLDAKYRMPEGAAGLNADLYQVSAYLDRYGLEQGVLVYARVGEETPGELRLLGTSKRLHLLSLDLSVHGPTRLDEQARLLAERVANLTDTHPRPLTEGFQG